MSKAREALNIIKSTKLYQAGKMVKDIGELRKEEIDVLQPIVNRDEAKPVNHLHPLKSFGKCPSCNKSVHILHHRQFCGECGTRLDWRKDE